MLDPFPIAPPVFLIRAIKPVSDALSLHSLPLHAHEIILAAVLYTFIEKVFSPWISNQLCPRTYNGLSRKSRLNWDVHVVSFVQSILICALSLYVIWYDEERKAWRPSGEWQGRIWGYYGSGGLCQSFALGYFLWDLYICSMNPEVFGPGMLAHAVSAVAVFGLGYRPFVYYSAPIFLLYELSSPFLNIHWFCDKLDLTGSIYQAVNGVFLTLTFFFCRLVWGSYNSVLVFRDAYWAIQAGHMDFSMRTSHPMDRLSIPELLAISRDPIGQTKAFVGNEYVPFWIVGVTLASNLTLTALNVVWFGKMIATIRKRFDPPFGTKGVGPDKVQYEPEEKAAAGNAHKRKSSIQERLDTGAAAAAEGANGLARAATGGNVKTQTPVAVDGDVTFGMGGGSGSAKKAARSRRKA